MPICSCPHCQTYLKVKESQLNVAQGFVKCVDCEGLFKAKDFVVRQKVASIDWLPEGVSDIDLVRRLGTYVRGRNSFDKRQVDYLLEHPAEAGQPAAVPNDQEHRAAKPVPMPEPPRSETTAPAKSGGPNWTLAALVALTVLILQLFFILLSRQAV